MTASNVRNWPESGNWQHRDPQTMVEGLRKHIKALEGKAQLRATAGYLELVAKNVELAVHARENGNFCAMHSAPFPIEIFWPLGIMPLCTELYSTISGIIGDDSSQFLSIPEVSGFPPRSRSNLRSTFGGTEVGASPLPDFVVYSSSACDPARKTRNTEARAMDVPCFGLDRPCKIFTPQSIDYWLKEHLALIQFLEERTGRSMDYDYLKEVAKLSFRATQVYLEINELRGAVPCPMPAEAAFAPLAVYRAWAGTQTCVDFLEQLRDELSERVAKGIGAVPQEKFRYTFATSPLVFDLGILAEAERRYGAVNVMDHLQWWREDADWLIDPEDPVASIANRVQFEPSNSLHGTATDHAEEVRQAALKCKADGVVHFNNVDCRPAAGGYRILKDTIERSLDLPWATIDCDRLDKSFTTFDGVMDQLDSFFETIENSKPYQDKTPPRGQQTHEPRGTA